jgi:hypothetical protein
MSQYRCLMGIISILQSRDIMAHKTVDLYEEMQ